MTETTAPITTLEASEAYPMLANVPVNETVSGAMLKIGRYEFANQDAKQEVMEALGFVLVLCNVHCCEVWERKAKSNAPTIGNRPQSARYPYAVFNEGDRCHVNRYTDVSPATVVSVSASGASVTVRMDKAELDTTNVKPEMVPGGFSAHCTNQRDLEYKIEEDPNGATETFTLRKWRGRYVWTRKGTRPDGKMEIGAGWVRFYDYNF